MSRPAPAGCGHHVGSGLAPLIDPAGALGIAPAAHPVPTLAAHGLAHYALDRLEACAMSIDVLVLGGALAFGAGSAAFARWSRIRLERADPARRRRPAE